MNTVNLFMLSAYTSCFLQFDANKIQYYISFEGGGQEKSGTYSLISSAAAVAMPAATIPLLIRTSFLEAG